MSHLLSSILGIKAPAAGQTLLLSSERLVGTSAAR